jgi:aspartokinase/homoserine dehydrogenase 1
MSQKWKVHKFGGTSVLDASRYRNVAKIIEQSPGSKAVVVSAMKGTTDELLRSIELSGVQNADYKKCLDQIHLRHQREIQSLLTGELRDILLQVVSKDIGELEEILRGVWLVKKS